MLTVYKSDDTIVLQIHDVKFTLKYLNYEERMNIVTRDRLEGGTVFEDSAHRIYQAIKHCVKGVEGAKYADGGDYSLEFDDDGTLSKKSVNELLSSSYGAEIIHGATAYVAGQNDGQIKNMHSGDPIEGVKLYYEGKSKKKASRARRKSK